jgi:hypothetical protein
MMFPPVECADLLVKSKVVEDTAAANQPEIRHKSQAALLQPTSRRDRKINSPLKLGRLAGALQSEA